MIGGTMASATMRIKDGKSPWIIGLSSVSKEEEAAAAAAAALVSSPSLRNVYTHRHASRLVCMCAGYLPHTYPITVTSYMDSKKPLKGSGSLLPAAIPWTIVTTIKYPMIMNRNKKCAIHARMSLSFFFVCLVVVQQIPKKKKTVKQQERGAEIDKVTKRERKASFDLSIQCVQPFSGTEFESCPVDVVWARSSFSSPSIIIWKQRRFCDERCISSGVEHDKA